MFSRTSSGAGEPARGGTDCGAAGETAGNAGGQRGGNATAQGEPAFFEAEERCVIPEGVTDLRDFPIQCRRENMKELILPSTIQRIQKHCFSYYQHLQKIRFPEGLLEIEEGAFKNCRALKEVLLPDSLQLSLIHI